ncbi:MAG: hypothetical protein E7365_04475 [Clostridiales bacterium]|nr:hypothetical protein [Clostridiales bacterium]
MKDSVRVPIALQVVVDDFGWFEGKNGLADSRPARTGINRNHVLEDYVVMNEIGKKVGMKIVCGFTIGEWDKDNVLRGMEHATWDEEGWDRASKIDYELAQKCFEQLEKSDYIELAFHGLMHGYWVNGENYGNPREFFSYDIPLDTKERKVNYPVKPVPASYVDEHLNAFFKIYNSWGFSQKIRTFIMPASLYKDIDTVLEYAAVAEKYGIKYWKNFWAELNDATTMLNSIVFLNTRGGDMVEWYEIDVEPEQIADKVYNTDNNDEPAGFAILGSHWPNFLSSDPSKNLENVDKWANYLNRQKEIFGYMLSKDIAFAASQVLYNKFLKLDFTDDTCIIDTSEVDAQNAPELSRDIYISIKNDKVVKECIGAELEVYEKHDEFTTYKLTRKDKNLIKLVF